VATPVALRPGSVFGPGQLGKRYRTVSCLSTTPDGKPAGNFADFYRVELALGPVAPQPHPRTYATKVLRDVSGDGGRKTRRRGWKHETGVVE
jgi:molybdopterin biosynthesis enzyme